ncbi:MAG: ABC transporter ATP-binding protein [Propionibacteriaceae bacterium]|jgi:peptide/nickel transport system ATP-binding protein|nr:ABC transporter ATP-binding protein [Propionibacteriaceae bacterium]
MTLQVESLSVEYRTPRGVHPALRELSFCVEPGQSYGLVGESGSGKSTAALALVRYLARNGRVSRGRITLDGTDVLGIEGEELRQYRAKQVAMVYQEPVRSLNPTMRVGAQIAESLGSGPGTSSEVLLLLERVGFEDPGQIALRYPHQLSGGQAQRVVISMALASRPQLLILDEPTTGLDVQIEAAVLGLIDELRADLDAAVVMISHNLPLVAARCDRVGVLKDGILVEEGDAQEVLSYPQHEYTQELIAALPDIDVPKSGGSFRRSAPVVLRAEGVRKLYGGNPVVDDVDLEIRSGEVLALVGESGSGKTTLGRAVAGLTRHEGRIDINPARGERNPVQIVFQNPDASLNPKRTVRRILQGSIRLLGGDSSVESLMEQVGLDPSLADRYARELSGGQQQRVAIARAFAGPTTLVVCDEPVSSLDVSVQAKIIDLLRQLQERTGVAYLFISHDLAVVRALADRIAVMRHGKIIETGPADDIYTAPRRSYTKALLRAARYQPTHALEESFSLEPSSIEPRLLVAAGV